MSKNIILASQSTFRKAQLEQLGFQFQCQSPDIAERQIENEWGGDLKDLAEHLAFKKAEVIASNKSEAIVIGSDQMLIFNQQSSAKPETRAQCIERLQTLQGQTHELHTGLCVIHQGQIKKSTTVARMTMHPLSQAEIEKYTDLDQPLGCAGGYKIEKKGLNLFREIETTDHSSIVGLPLLSLVSILRQWGISIL